MGGIKLVNVQTKSEVSKVKCLIDITINPSLNLSYSIFLELLGIRKGGPFGRDLIFLQQSYMQQHLKTSSNFYKEALLAIYKLDLSKDIPNVNQWKNEHLFSNKYFHAKEVDKTFTMTKYFETRNLVTFGQFLEEKVKEIGNQPFDTMAVSLYNDIVYSLLLLKNIHFT